METVSLSVYPDGRIVYDDNHIVEYNPDKPNIIIWSHFSDTENKKGEKWGSYYKKINIYDVGQVTLEGNQLKHGWWTQFECYNSSIMINEYGAEETIWSYLGYEKVVEKSLILYKDDSDW